MLVDGGGISESPFCARDPSPWAQPRGLRGQADRRAHAVDPREQPWALPAPSKPLPIGPRRSVPSLHLRGASRTRGLTWRLLTCWAPATSVASAPEATYYYGCTRPYTTVRWRTYARVRRLAHDAVTTSRQRRSAHGRWPRDHVIEISPSHGEPEETGLRRHSGRPLSGPIRTSAFEEKRRNK